MAATLEGAFDIRDKASAKLIVMRQHAEATDKAFERLGHRLDELGSNKRQTQLNSTSRSLRTLGLDAENAAKRTDHLARRSKQADAAIGGWGGRLRMVTRGMKDFGMELFKIARPGAILTGLPTLLGLAGQAVGSLAGSLFSLGPRIADLGALSAVALPGITGLAGGMMLLSTSAKTLGQAMQGGTAGAQALLKGGPALAGVVRQLRAMRFELRGLTRAGQTPIFRAISGALPLFRSRIPQLRGMLGQLGGATGGALTGLTRGTLGSNSFMRDLGGLTAQGASVITAVGQALTHVARAMVSVGAAARPLTHWVNGLIVGWAKHFEQTMNAQRASGELAQKFDRARKAATGLLHFVHDLWVTLRNLGRDARPAGEILYRYIGGVGRTWRQMSGDQNRSVRLTKQFLGMTRGFIALSNLIGHTTAGIFNMGAGSAFPRLVQSLDKAIPPLLNFFSAMAQNFGPAIGNLLTTLTQTFQLMSGASGGPMLLMLNTLNGLLGAVNGLVKALGPFGRILSVAFEGAVLLRFLSKLKLVEVGWRRVAVAATEAATAENAAAGGGIGIRPGAALQGIGFGGTGRFARMGMRRRFLAGGPRFVGTAGGEMIDAAALSRFGGLTGAARGAGMLSGAGRLALGVGSKFLLPLSLIMGAFGALSAQRSGNIGNQALQTGYGGLNAATGGLIGAGLGAMGVHPLETSEQRAGRLVGISQHRLNEGLRNADAGTGGMRRLNREIDVLQVTMQGFARDQTDAGKQYRDQLQQEIDARKSVIAQLKTEAETRGARAAGTDVAAMNEAFRKAGGGARGTAAGLALGRRILQSTPGRDPGSQRERVDVENAMIQGTHGVQRAAVEAQIRSFERQHGSRVAFGPRYTGYSGTTYGYVYRGGRAIRQDILKTMSGAERVRENRQTAFTPLENALLANLIASGFKESSARMWINRWEARGQKGPIVPPDVMRYWDQQRAFRHRAAGQATSPGAAPNNRAPVRHSDIAPAGGPGDLVPYWNGRQWIDPVSGRPVNAASQVYWSSQYPNPASRPRRHATGGRIAGRGLSDTVPVGGGMAAPGELIVNRHTERKANYLLGAHGTSLGGLVDGETTPHSRRFARGGRNDMPAPGNYHGLPMPLPAITALSDVMLGRFPGLSVTATRNGTHANASYHYLGEAVDLAAPMDKAGMGLMDRAAKWVGATFGGSLLEGIHNPTLSIKNGKVKKPGFWGASTWAGHRNHIHLATGKFQGGGAGGGAGGGGGAGQYGIDPIQAAKASSYNITRALSGARDVSGLGGLPIPGDRGSVAAELGGAGAASRGDAGGGAVGTGAVGKLNRLFPRFVQGSGGRHAQLTPAQVTTIAQSVGLPGSMFEKIAHGESSYYPGVQQRDPGDGNVGYGLWQMTPHAWGANSTAMKYMNSLGGIPQMFNPVKNAKMAKFLYDHASSQTPKTPGFPWYGTRYLTHGGRIPQWGGWHQGGLDRTFSTPTMIGVGDGGHPERVRVTKTGRGGSGAQIHAVFHIHGGEPGRVQREVEAALHSFADELDRHYGSDAGGE